MLRSRAGLVAIQLGLDFGPEDTSTLFGIPTPTEALTAKNAAYAAGILALLMVLVAIPTTLFNTALEQHLGRPAPGDFAPSALRSVLWRWGPVTAYTVVGAVMFSLLEPQWGANPATVVTGASFWVVLVVFMTLGIVVKARQERLRYQTSTGRPVLSFKTLLFAALCVGGSRAIAFVPGFLYGVIVSYQTETEFSDRDEADIARLTVGAVFLLAIAAWIALDPFERAFGTSGLRSLPTGVSAALFMGGVEAVLIGLLPLRLLPGATLRRYHPMFWRALWAMSGFLFALAMLRPGLASAHSRSTGLILVGAAVYGGFAVAFWGLTTRRRLLRLRRQPRADEGRAGADMDVAPS